MKMAAAKPPKKVRQVRSVKMLPDRVFEKRRSFNSRKAVIHSPRQIITTMKVRELRIRPAQECSNPELVALRRVAWPDFQNWRMQFFTVQSCVSGKFSPCCFIGRILLQKD
jgi:hypothetical protein